MNRQSANDNEQTLISMKQVCNLTSLSRTMVNRLRSQGRFPEIVDLGDRRVAFVKSEVVDWIQKKIEARKAA